VSQCVAVLPIHCIPDNIGNGKIVEMELRKDVEELGKTAPAPLGMEGGEGAYSSALG